MNIRKSTKDAIFLMVILLLALVVIIMAAPGFEAIFTIAGLLAIAYLVLKHPKEAITSEQE